jgi:hypothetical protein
MQLFLIHPEHRGLAESRLTIDKRVFSDRTRFFSAHNLPFCNCGIPNHDLSAPFLDADKTKKQHKVQVTVVAATWLCKARVCGDLRSSLMIRCGRIKDHECPALVRFDLRGKRNGLINAEFGTHFF